MESRPNRRFELGLRSSAKPVPGHIPRSKSGHQTTSKLQFRAPQDPPRACPWVQKLGHDSPSPEGDSKSTRTLPGHVPGYKSGTSQSLPRRGLRVHQDSPRACPWVQKWHTTVPPQKGTPSPPGLSQGMSLGTKWGAPPNGILKLGTRTDLLREARPAAPPPSGRRPRNRASTPPRQQQLLGEQQGLHRHLPPDRGRRPDAMVGKMGSSLRAEGHPARRRVESHPPSQCIPPSRGRRWGERWRG